MSEQNNKKTQSDAHKRRVDYYPKHKNCSAVNTYANICDISKSKAVDILVSIGLNNLPPDHVLRMEQAKLRAE